MTAPRPPLGQPTGWRARERKGTGEVARGTVWFDGRALRSARTEKGLSLDDFATRLRAAGWPTVSRQTPIDYEAGLAVPEPARLALLARTLETNPAALSALELDQVRLTDLRHWAGLTARAAAEQFGFSRWSLLRLEHLGILPHREAHRRFVERAVRTYDVIPEMVERAWDRVLACAERWITRSGATRRAT